MESLRKEFSSYRFHSRLSEMCGKACVNCGDTEEITYHHIVPLEVGGTNNFTNIVPLCMTCHMKVHMMDFAKAQRIAKCRIISGRKRSCPENYKSILNDFFHCRISKSKCSELLGVKGNFADSVWFSEYKREQQIKGYRNNIDIICSRKNSGLTNNKKIGWIIYNDGTKKEFVYREGAIDTQ